MSSEGFAEREWAAEVNSECQWRFDDGILLCADALNTLRLIPDEVADLIFLDPPFNLGKRYGKSRGGADRKDPNEYSQFMHEVLDESVRALRPGGALYLYHMPIWALRLGHRLTDVLEFRHWIAVSMKNGSPKPGGLYPAHYALLFFTKGDPAFFTRPKIPAPRCRTCNEYIKDYGGYKEHIEDGINVSDIWDDFSPVRHPANKNRPGNELPLDLLRRVLGISGNQGGLLIDPFAGAGTSLVAAREHGMSFVGIDRERVCCDIAVDRLER